MDELRKIIYRERNDLESFFRENQLWEDLYDDFFLDSLNSLQGAYTFYEPDALTFLNDVHFGCIKVLIDPHPENLYRKKFLNPCFSSFLDDTEDSILVTSMMYAILSLSQQRDLKNVKRFLKTTDKILSHSDIFQKAQTFVKNNKADYFFRLDTTPISPDTLDYDHGPNLPQLWLDLIKSFVQSNGRYNNVLSFRRILSLYSIKEDKLKAFRQMKYASDLEYDPDETHHILSALYEEINSIQTAKENMSDAVAAPLTAPPEPAEPAPAMNNTSVQPVNDAVDDSTPSAKQGNIPLLPFKEEGGLDKWASLVKEAVKDIEDHTLNSRLDNTMFAVMFYFSSGWKKRKGIFKKAPTTTALVHFFLYRCDFNPEKVKPKTLVNRLNDLFKESKEIENTEEIERVKKKIQNIITKNY